MIDDPRDERDDERIDFSALAARHDPARLDAAVRAIVADGLRARRRDVSSILGQWLPHALAAAALIAAVLLPAVRRSAAPRAPQPSVSTAQILGVPQPLIDLVTSTPRPSLEDLARALNAEVPDGGGPDVR